MLRFLYLVCIFQFAVQCLYAQQRTFHGVLYEQGTAQRVGSAIIKNNASGVSVRSNNLGEFIITAAPTDTLLISKPEYVDYKLEASSKKIVLIQLLKIRKLAEVVITGQTKKQEMEEVLQGYRKKGVYYNGKPPLLSYIFKPLTAIYELVGKDPSNARRFNNYYHREIEELEIDRRFNVLLVKRLTGLEGNDLQNFMVSYRPGYAKIITWNEYDLMSYVSKSFKVFNLASRPAPPALPPLIGN
jgi:hypothetical protein